MKLKLKLLAPAILAISVLPLFGTEYLIKDSRPCGGIYLPGTMNKAAVMAVDELRTHLKKMTDCELPVIYAAPNMTSSPRGIFLEIRPRAEWDGKESPQAFRIIETEGGRGKQPSVTIRGNSGLGLLYGVYQYLSDNGVRWFTPGEEGTNIPKKDSLAIGNRDFTSTPRFIYRCLDFSGINEWTWDLPAEEMKKAHHEWDLWLLRNRLLFDRSLHFGHDFDFARVDHSITHSLSAMCGLDKKLFESGKERERFALVTKDFKQERRFEYAQICFTNRKNIETAIKSCLKMFESPRTMWVARDPDLSDVNTVAPMSLNDCRGICECPACKEAAGPEPYAKDRLVWKFMNAVASGLAKKAPGKKIYIFSPYFELTMPPEDVKLEKNIIAVTCRNEGWNATKESAATYPLEKKFRERIERHAAAGAELMNYDYIFWKTTPMMLTILDAAKFYAENGYTRYHAEVMQRSEQLWPILWSLAQFIWNGKEDPFKYLEEFCREYYGPEGGALVLEIMKQIDANARRSLRVIYGEFSDISNMLDTDFCRKYRPLLANAVKKAAGLEKPRLEKFYRSLEAQMLAAETYRAFCKALIERTSEAEKEFRDKGNAFLAFYRKNRVNELMNIELLRVTELMLKTDIGKLAPIDRKIDEKDVLNELFAGEAAVPAKIENLVMLPKNWKFCLDYLDAADKEHWEKPDFDDSKWPEISTWNWVESQGYTEVGGNFWYRLKFKSPAFPAGKKIFLRIGSLDDCGRVYVNGHLVYENDDRSCWDKSFEADVTEFWHNDAENLIAVYGSDTNGACGIWRPSALYTK